MSDQTNQPDSMSESTRKNHRKYAVDCFNKTWGLLDNPTRTSSEDMEMIHTAHASRYHWGQIGTPLEFARGDWQISRVYAVLSIGGAAHRYAQSCLDHCLENNIGDFDLAFAYEALARANAVLDDKEKQEKFIQLASNAGQGYATEAAGALTRFGFEELGINKIFASCDTRNLGSARVLEKIRMKRVGHKQKHLWQKGDWRDSFLYAILADEWSVYQ